MSTREAVLDVLAKHARCEVSALAADVVLVDVGINSLKFITALLEIEKATGKKVMDMNKIGNLKTVGDVVALAEGA